MNSTKNVINHITCQNFNKSYESKLEDFCWLLLKSMFKKTQMRGTAFQNYILRLIPLNKH